jgi:Protein of unknown function (DUF1592)/Protein of unknown function (DUF1588)/Protein of unknown function (DUF1585)
VHHYIFARTVIPMTTRILFGLLFAAGLSAQTPSPITKVVETYCSGCHNGRVEPSGARLASLDPANIAASPELWSRAERHLRAGTMPPVGAPRPDRRTVDEVIAGIERELDIPAPPAETSQAIATRLATLLWNAAPDAPLLQAAKRDELGDPAVLETQVRRMLANPRSEAFVSRFLFPWLQLDKLAESDPDRRFFPDYDPSLSESLRRETELFLLSQLSEDRDPIELWTANYTFLNELLAKHYGIADVTGSQFRRVTLRSPERAGLLGQGSILMVTSRHQHGVDAAYTSPATRGKWVLTHFLGVSTPTTFPGAQPVSPDLPITGQTRRLPANPCTNCHRNFFPLGYALENFDPIGRWRTQDQAGPVDASAALVDGTPSNGPVELRNALMQRPDAFRTTIAERLLAYAADRSFATNNATTETLAAVRRILRDKNQIRWSTLIAGVVRTKPLASE